jgi:hypothetical protein
MVLKALLEAMSARARAWACFPPARAPKPGRASGEALTDARPWEAPSVRLLAIHFYRIAEKIV